MCVYECADKKGNQKLVNQLSSMWRTGLDAPRIVEGSEEYAPPQELVLGRVYELLQRLTCPR